MRPLPSPLILALPFPPVFVHQSASCQFFTPECSSPPPTRLNVHHPLQLAFLSFPSTGSTRVSSFVAYLLSPSLFVSESSYFCSCGVICRIIISSILIIYYKGDVMALRYASGLFQAYFPCFSLLSPFITKLLKGAIFRLKNIFYQAFVAAQEICRPRRPPSSPSS